MRHPKYLLRKLTASEWNDWIEYALIEPFGFAENDVRFGRLMSLISATHGAAESPSRFMIDPPPDDEVNAIEFVKDVLAANSDKPGSSE